MERKDELVKAIEGAPDNIKSALLPLIDDVVFLEARLSELRKLPFIKTHPKDLTLQKPTPAAKQYKELLQQYNNCIKIMISALKKSEDDEGGHLSEVVKMLHEQFRS